MPTTKAVSATYKQPSKVRTITNRFQDDRLCRYLISGNRRCQRTSAQTGSGLCILHDRQLLQRRDAESRSLSHRALGDVKELNTRLAIHNVMSRVLILGLERRYSPREVAVFTSAFRTLYTTLDGAHSELRNLQGFFATNPLIAASINAEPTLRHLQKQYEQNQILVEKAAKEKAAAKAARAARIEKALVEQAAAERKAKRWWENTPDPKTTNENPSNNSTAPQQNPNDPSQHNNNAQAAKPELQRQPEKPEEDPNDGSIPYTHIQSYGGIVVPMKTRLRIDK